MNHKTKLSLTYFGKVNICRLFWFLLTSWVAGLRVDGPAVQRVRPRGEDGVDLARVLEGHEPEPPRPPRLGVLHHHTVDDLAETTKVPQQRILSGIPTEI